MAGRVDRARKRRVREFWLTMLVLFVGIGVTLLYRLTGNPFFLLGILGMIFSGAMGMRWVSQNAADQKEHFNRILRGEEPDEEGWVFNSVEYDRKMARKYHDLEKK